VNKYEYEIGKACGTCGYDTCMYRILVGKPKSKRSLKELGGDGRITLNSILERHKLGNRW